MAEISVAGDTLDVEIIAANEDAEFRLYITYKTEAGDIEKTQRQLSIDSRGKLTVEWVEDTLNRWMEYHETAETITEFEVAKYDPARRGGESQDGESQEPADGPDQIEQAPEKEVSIDVSFSAGERVAYHVDGPDSTIYGYTTEAIVVELPPIKKQHKDPVTDKVKINTGDDAKLIPAEWVVGPVSEVDVDKPNPDI